MRERRRREGKDPGLFLPRLDPKSPNFMFSVRIYAGPPTIVRTADLAFPSPKNCPDAQV